MISCQWYKLNWIFFIIVLKPGKVVIVLRGKYAGKKAVIVQAFDEGSDKRPYPHALIVGIDRAPLKVTKSMSKKKISQRIRIRPFIKIVNYSHLLPTRYNLENIDFKNIVTEDAVLPSNRQKIKRKIKPILEERHLSGENKWFFTKLRF